MSKPITIKLQEKVLKEAERFIPRSKLGNRNAYINEAVKRFNAMLARQELAIQYRHQSEMVRKESTAILSEFEALSDDISE